MNCKIPVIEFNKEDCLGDSLAKHNYNMMLLDTKICNLMSFYFNGVVNFDFVYHQLKDINDKYENNLLANFYDNTLLEKYSIAATTVNQLSAFWERNTFSVVYPINGSIASGSDKRVNVISSLKNDEQSIINLIDKNLKNLAKSYLTTNFNPVYYKENTVINIIFSIFNITPTSSDSTSNSPLIKSTISDPFTYLNRKMYATFTRDNIHLTRNVILGFINQNNNWTFVGSLI